MTAPESHFHSSRAFGAAFGMAAFFPGTPGNDTYGGGADDDTLTGEAGNDSLDGGGDDDTLWGGAGNDTLNGGAGSDLIDAGTGADRVNGGDGYDFVQLEYGAFATNVVYDARAAATDGGFTLNNGTVVRNVEAMAFFQTGAGNDALIVDLASGRFDAWFAGTGTDVLIADFSADSHGITTQDFDGNDYYVSTALYNSEAFDIDAVRVTGGSGRDAFSGTHGNDWLNGGGGADTLSGEGGDDSYVVDDGGDIIVEAADGGTDQVSVSVSYVLADNVETLSLSGHDAINATGNGSANYLGGNSGANVLNGAGGADKLHGLGGDDTYVVDNAGVHVSETGTRGDTGGDDTVMASVSFRLGAFLETLILTGTADINGTGNGTDNVLRGNAGHNHLTGGGGNDTLGGGGGSDIFVFGAGSGVDVITDFSRGEHDRISVHALAHGVTGGGGIGLVQSGADVVIDLGGGNNVTVAGAVLAQVEAQMLW